MSLTKYYKQPEIEGRSNPGVKVKIWSLLFVIVMFFLIPFLSSMIPESIKSLFGYTYIISTFCLFFLSFTYGFTFSNKEEIKFTNDYQELVIGKNPPILLNDVEQIIFFYFGERPDYKPSEKKRFKRNIGIEILHNRTFLDNLEIDNFVTFFLINSQEDKVNYFNFINQMHYFNPLTKLIVGRDEVPLPVDPYQVFLVNENRQLLK